MKNIFIRFRINKCLSILEKALTSDGITYDEQSLLVSKKYLPAIHILEAEGCIKCTYSSNDPYVPYLINPIHRNFPRYYIKRHDVWTNRLLGFILGAASASVANFILFLSS